jgi:uncharacterized protein (DUF4415 family)
MAKKSPVLYQPEKPQKKKPQRTLKIAESLAVEYNTLLQKSDKDIDLSDIPELDFESSGKPVVGKFYHPIKKPISLRMDADVLEWFKQHPRYQQLINKACRLYMFIDMRRQARSNKPSQKNTLKNK